MAMNVTVPASAVFFHYVIIESINVLLVLVEFIKLIICHIIFNGNNFSKKCCSPLSVRKPAFHG